ncbi:MAG: GspH/FimT family pseudopilin [Burkholderiales bacterium]|jgi:type IV fimbrial biogenesis protein FimT|nr:GspH/FimT family pseudopilin [Burkholderiales bacterium]
MTVKKKYSSGATLIELMIAIAIFAIVVVMGIPSFRIFLENGKIRNVTESISNGMQKARLHAVQRNTNVAFYINAAGQTWGIYEWDTSLETPAWGAVETFNWSGRWPQISATVAPANANTVSFSSVGRTLSSNPTGGGLPTGVTTIPIFRVDVAGALTGSGIYPLRVEVQSNAPSRGIRTCSPHLPATDPKGCVY